MCTACRMCTTPHSYLSPFVWVMLQKQISQQPPPTTLPLPRLQPCPSVLLLIMTTKTRSQGGLSTTTTIVCNPVCAIDPDASSDPGETVCGHHHHPEPSRPAQHTRCTKHLPHHSRACASPTVRGDWHHKGSRYSWAQNSQPNLRAGSTLSRRRTEQDTQARQQHTVWPTPGLLTRLRTAPSDSQQEMSALQPCHPPQHTQTHPSCTLLLL